MIDFLASVVVILIAAYILSQVSRGLEADKARVLMYGLGAKVVASVALMSITKYYYGYGDMLSYLNYGHNIVRYIEYSGSRGFSDTISILLQENIHVPVRMVGIGRTSGTMTAICGLMLYVVPSDWAVNFIFSMVGFTGQVALLMAFWGRLPANHHRVAAWGCLFVPSVVFWSAGVVKEALAIGGLGLFSLALVEVAEKRWGRVAILGILGVFLIWLSKPFVLLALSCGLAAAGYAERARRGGERVTIRPVLLVLWAAIGVAALFAIGELFPKYSITGMAEEVALQQSNFNRVEGGSDFEVASLEGQSFFQQIAFAPLALVTSCFRPFLFEVSNVVMLANAIEATGFLVLFLLMLKRHGLRLIGELLQSPALLYSAVVVIVLGTGVGLTTSNMGTLSRYRIPMLPFFAVLLLALGYEKVGARRKRQSSNPPPRSRALRGAPPKASLPSQRLSSGQPLNSTRS